MTFILKRFLPNVLVFSGTDHIDMKSLPGDDDPMGRGELSSIGRGFIFAHARKKGARPRHPN